MKDRTLRCSTLLTPISWTHHLERPGRVQAGEDHARAIRQAEGRREEVGLEVPS